ncbi:MAG: peptide ABC transporter substrate-binding protein [Gammaproteobacteria bacterium]|nr:peptide ABC transporter substrate-binding protein [Gammaproteobacteria bacterium]
MNRFIITLVTTLAIALCGSIQAEPELDILTIGNSAEPGTLDPHRYFANAEEHILKDLFLGLTTMGPRGEILPGLATSWKTSEDGLQWRFELNPDATWSDSQPLTAKDFVYGLRRHQDPQTASPLAHFLYCIKNAESINRGHLAPDQLGVSIEDEHTLVIDLEQPFPFLLERLLYPIAYPIPEHTVKKHGDAWVKAENWVSNGPYVLNEWRPREYVELRRNAHFIFAHEAIIGTVRYYPFQEPATAYNRFVAGDMDIVHGYPHTLVSRVLQERPNEVQNAPLQSIMYLVINTREKPFDDARVRAALAAAISRNRITDQVLAAGEIPSETLSPPLVSGQMSHGPDAESSVERAIALLTEAGFDESQPLGVTLRYISGAENKRVYVAIAAMWKDAGINTTLHHTNLATHFSDLQNGDFEVAQAGWFGENNPEHYIELLWSKIGPANYGRYQSAKFDALFEEARKTADLQSRLEMLTSAEEIALEDFPVIPLYVTMTLNLVKTHVGGWQRNGRNLHPVRFMHWVESP